MKIIPVEFGHRFEIHFDSPVKNIEPVNHVVTELLTHYTHEIDQEPQTDRIEIDWRDDQTMWVWVMYK